MFFCDEILVCLLHPKVMDMVRLYFVPLCYGLISTNFCYRLRWAVNDLHFRIDSAVPWGNVLHGHTTYHIWMDEIRLEPKKRTSPNICFLHYFFCPRHGNSSTFKKNGFLTASYFSVGYGELHSEIHHL